MMRTKAIAISTFRELVRSKILYSILFFAFLMVTASYFFGSVTIGDQVMVIKDFGLFSISLFSVAFAVISGAALLHKELSRKTVYNILAKPVTRAEFVFGKYLGMLFTVGLMILMMGLALSIFVYLFIGNLDYRLAQACLYILTELMIVCAAAIFFSSIVVTPMLSGLFTFGIFMAGRSTSQLLYFVESGHAAGFSGKVIQLLYWLLPRLDLLNVGNDLVYGASIGADHFLLSLLYAVGYSGILLILASAIFKRREFN